MEKGHELIEADTTSGFLEKQAVTTQEIPLLHFVTEHTHSSHPEQIRENYGFGILYI